MDFFKFLFLIIEFMVVIKSLHSVVTFRCDTPLLQNGYFDTVDSPIGEHVEYYCRPTFSMIGSKYSYCAYGQWKDPVPMCIKPGCLHVIPSKHGLTIPGRDGALTMLFCKPGYSIVGSHITYCNGISWDRSIGSCQKTQSVHAMSCDFEVSTICDWVADYTHDINWIWKYGYTSVNKLQSGPAHDHTVGIPLKGYFMLATFVNPLLSSKARLISPMYPANTSQNACFRLYYHMYEATAGALRVYVKPESITIAEIFDAPKYLFMEIMGSFPNDWLESVFNIDQYDEDFQIIIEATSKPTTLSNIAIDDVALLNGADCLDEGRKSTVLMSEASYLSNSIDVSTVESRGSMTSTTLNPTTSTQTTFKSISTTTLFTTSSTALKTTPKSTTPRKRITLPAATTLTTPVSTSTKTTTIIPTLTIPKTTPTIPTTSTLVMTVQTTEDSSITASSEPVTFNTRNETENDEFIVVDGTTDTYSLSKESKTLLIVFGILLMIVIIAVVTIITFKLFNKYKKHTYICNRYPKGWYENSCQEVTFEK